MMELLQRDAEVQEVVQLVGPDALQDSERLILDAGVLLREVFLQQNAFSENDAFSSHEKTAGLLEALLEFYDLSRKAVECGTTLSHLSGLPVREQVIRLRNVANASFQETKMAVVERMRADFIGLTSKKG